MNLPPGFDEPTLKMIVETAPLPLAIINANLTYKFANEAWAASFDQTGTFDAKRKLAVDFGSDALEARLAEGNVGFELRHQGGTVKRFRVYAVLLPDDSRLLHVHDLTAQRRLEIERLIADRRTAVGALGAGVAHEINNPLSYVIGNLDYIREEVAGVLHAVPKARQRELVDAIAESLDGAKKIKELVRDLQTFARGNANPRSPANVKRVIDASLAMAWIEIKHRARLRVEIAEGLPPVAADQARLGQVVLNLLLNAAQALPLGRAAHNEIVVSAREVDGGVRIEVSDTGAGIPKEQLPLVFEPFFTATPVGVGPGLGLTIAHHLVGELKGEIDVRSELGKGTSFSVFIRTEAGTGQRGANDPRVVVYEPDTRLAVLVIDDEPLVGRTIERALREHRVTIASSGKKAIEVLSDQSVEFDLIFCDLLMSELTGREVYAWIQRSRPGVEERMVFMTGGGSVGKEQAFLEEIDNPRLRKPFDLEQIRAVARETAPRVIAAGATAEPSGADT